MEDEMFDESVERGFLQRETDELRSFNETMLLFLKDLYLSVMILEVDKNVVYPIHLTEEGKAAFTERGEMERACKDMIQFYHPEDQPQMRKEITLEYLKSLMEQGKKKLIREYRRNIQGEYRWVSITCYFMPRLSGNRQVLIAIQDIHEQKKQEKEYQEYLTELN